MSKSIFISCVFEDNHRIDSIKKWVSDKRLGDITIIHETEDKRQQGVEVIKNHIQEKIRGASAIVVLVGNDTHNHNWIKAEVELANSFHKQILCVRVPNTKGAVPTILNKYKLVNFDPDTLKKAIE
jgi:hypothetical protein